MEEIKTAPRRLYFMISYIIEMLMLFFYSVIYMNKPSGSLTNEDIDNIRRKRKS